VITEVRRNLTAVILGGLGGLAFACGTWGYDMIVLAVAHAIVPWAKFLPGMLITVLTGGLCGLLTAKSGKLGLVMLIWVIWGTFVTWIAGMIPIYFLEPITILFHPKLAGVIEYPMLNLQVRLFLTFLVMFGLTLIFSFLYQNVLESLVVNLHPLNTILFVCVWLVFFIMMGTSIDTIYNQPLRRAAQLTHDSIQTAISHPQELDQGRAALKLGILSMRPMKTVINQPYWTVIKSYDETLEQVQVMVDFSGYWFTCEVGYNTIYVCKQTVP
jgi:hypothetical protein